MGKGQNTHLQVEGSHKGDREDPLVTAGRARGLRSRVTWAPLLTGAWRPLHRSPLMTPSPRRGASCPEGQVLQPHLQLTNRTLHTSPSLSIIVIVKSPTVGHVSAIILAIILIITTVTISGD